MHIEWQKAEDKTRENSLNWYNHECVKKKPKNAPVNQKIRMLELETLRKDHNTQKIT